jgi:hypothetical protein
MLVIHTKPGAIYVTSLVPAEARDPRAYCGLSTEKSLTQTVCQTLSNIPKHDSTVAC